MQDLLQLDLINHYTIKYERSDVQIRFMATTLGTFRISFLKCYTYFVILLCKNITILIIFLILCINCFARYETNGSSNNIYE